MKTTATVVVLVFTLAATALGDSYSIPPDYRVTCLHLATGKALWHTKPPELAAPTISVTGEVVVAESTIRMLPAKARTVRYYLQPMSGKLIKGEVNVPKEGLVRPLATLPQNLKSSDGRVFDYDRGNTRHLVAVEDGEQKIVKQLASFPYDLNIVGDLAIYTFAGGVSIRDTGGGDVYAYDLKRDKIVWKFQASTKLPGLAPASYTSVSVDDDLVIVSVDQVLFALELGTGKLRWTAKLPRQTIRRYDSPWTRIGRVDDRLFVSCYEDLFVVEREMGKLVWSFDCGPFGKPWPTIKDNRVYVGTR